MKISCLIDSLNSGGAQRQLCMLAAGLKRIGFEVEILTYHRFDFFLPIVDQEQIPLKVIQSKSKLHRVLDVRKAIRDSKPDLLISYLNTPNVLAELSGLPFRNFGLIVSERNTEYQGVAHRYLRRFLLHQLADVVVTNSFAQAEFIGKTAPWLKKRLTTICNCVDLERFHPAFHDGTCRSDSIRILVLGRFENQKNPFALLSAVEILVKQYSRTELVVDWYGNDFFVDGKPTAKSSLFLQLKEEIAKRSLSEHFRLHPPEREVVKLYQSATLLCLPSLHEGCSNVICEAMACGLPVLASRVGDNPRLVDEGITGFLFSPHSPEDIANTILRFILLSGQEKTEMGRESRKKAERYFSRDAFVDKYQALFKQIEKLQVRSGRTSPD